MQMRFEEESMDGRYSMYRVLLKTGGMTCLSSLTNPEISWSRAVSRGAADAPILSLSVNIFAVPYMQHPILATMLIPHSLAQPRSSSWLESTFRNVLIMIESLCGVEYLWLNCLSLGVQNACRVT